MAELEKNEKIVTRFFEILSTGHLENIRATLHPDASWTPMVKGIPGAGVHQPRDVIVDEFLAPVRGIFEDGDPKTTIKNIFSKGSMVCVESFAQGKMKNGNFYDNQYCWVIEVKDDLIYRIHEYMDSLYVSSIV